MSAALHPHPEARFQTVEQMQEHLRGIIMRQDEQARRFIERQREIDSIEKAKLDALDRLNRKAAELAAARKKAPPFANRGPRDVQDIVHSIAIAHGVTFADIMSVSRVRRITRARFFAVVAVRAHRPDWSLARIGDFFGRDHTTILNALNSHARFMAPDTNKRTEAERRRDARLVQFLSQIRAKTVGRPMGAEDDQTRKRCSKEGLGTYSARQWWLTDKGRAVLEAHERITS